MRPDLIDKSDGGEAGKLRGKETKESDKKFSQTWTDVFSHSTIETSTR